MKQVTEFKLINLSLLSSWIPLNDQTVSSYTVFEEYVLYRLAEPLSTWDGFQCLIYIKHFHQIYSIHHKQILTMLDKNVWSSSRGLKLILNF